MRDADVFDVEPSSSNDDGRSVSSFNVWPAPPGREPPVEPVPTPPPARRLPGWLAIAMVAIVCGAGAGAITGRLARPAPRTAITSMTSGPGVDARAVIRTVSQSVVAIDTTATAQTRRGQITQQASGSGFFLTSDGMIATNNHVVAGATNLTVTLPDGSTAVATIVATDPSSDLAVIHIAKSGLAALSFGSSASAEVGQTVIALGNALALSGGPTASMGIVSALDRSITVSGGTLYNHLMQTDAAINPGDSGGPLVDANGLVIGIDTAGASSAESIGFAIPSDVAAPILNRLRTGG